MHSNKKMHFRAPETERSQGIAGWELFGFQSALKTNWMDKNKKIVVALVVGIVAVIGFGLYAMFVGVGVADPGLQDSFAPSSAGIQTSIEAQVANDAVQKYDIASRSGTAMDRCVQAGFVVAAYLQAKDESNYATWKETQKTDCYLAGVPQ